MRAIFIGRFQPIHLGHLHAIKKALEKFDELVIVIGSSNKENTYENPFSFEERKKMIESCLPNIKIIGMEDMENDENWVGTLLEKIEFDVVISGTDLTKKCFSGIKGIVEPDLLEPEKYNGTKIREMIIRGENWKDLVPEEIVEFIENINWEERLKHIIGE